MGFRPYKEREYGTSEAVITALVDQAGGIKRAAFLLDKTPSQVTGYTEAKPDSHLSYRSVRILVGATGATAPVEDLAALAGGYFMPGVREDDRTFSEVIARSAEEWGSFAGLIMRHLADGRFDKLERMDALRGLDTLIRAMATARSKLMAVPA